MSQEGGCRYAYFIAGTSSLKPINSIVFISEISIPLISLTGFVELHLTRGRKKNHVSC